MKRIVFMVSTAVLLSVSGFSQSEADTTEIAPREKNTNSLSVGTDGIKIKTSGKKDSSDKVFDVQFGMVDLGINYLDDKTNYSDPSLAGFLQVPGEMRNKSLFSLREGKSVNVNIYPVLAKYRLFQSPGQKIFLSAGVGLQIYNFRFNKPVTYQNLTEPAVVLNDSLHFSKNKLGFTYLSVPLMLTFRTRIAGKAWLVYGGGISAGYRISSWTKQVSSEHGKQKNHDAFNFKDFNSAVTAEIGLQDYFRLYFSYQLTPLHDTYLDQHPYTIGFRFMGI